MLKIVFMGTPEFAVPTLKEIHNAGHEICAVVTVPDRPAGRGQKVTESDVKQFAVSQRFKILQPEKLKNEDFVNELRNLNADLFVVVAFRMLPEIIWTMPRLGTINLHASLLPQYRGAAPINWAIINGEKESGVTTFFIEKEIDTGKIIFNEKVQIFDTDNAGILHDKLMATGADLMVKTLTAIEDKNFTPIAQHNIKVEELKAAPKIFKENCKIFWNRNGEQIKNLIRGLSPYPAAWTEFYEKEGNKKVIVKIFAAEYTRLKHASTFGTIESDEKNFVRIYTEGGYISLLELQLEGRKKMNIQEFLRGFKIGNYQIK